MLSRLPAGAPVPAPSPARPAIASAAPASPGGFGLPHDAGSARESSRIAAFKFDRFGIFTVTLANGQVWQQSSSDSTKAQWRADPARTAYNVVISEGILGSYDFKVIGMPGAYKVRRIK
jgi:hypothetical protein